MEGLTAKQMKNEARIRFESIASGDAPGFNDREWSVLLTSAQSGVVYDVYKEGLDKNEENRNSIQSLIRFYENEELELSDTLMNSFKVGLPVDYMFVIVDWCELANNQIKLIPISYDAFFSNKDNPFEKPDTNKFWKLTSSDDNRLTRIIITPNGIRPDTYKAKYIKRPYPIVVNDLNNGIEYYDGNEVTNESNCELHPNIHRRIVERAAKLAYASTLDPQGYQIQSIEEQRI